MRGGIEKKVTVVHRENTATKPLVDLRRISGRIWSEQACEPHQLDEYLYRGVQAGGPAFLQKVRGRFAGVWLDAARGSVLLCRDWVGEVPLHYYLTDEELIVANKISDIKDYLGPENFVYEFVRAVPHAHVLELDVREAYAFGTSRRRSFQIKRQTLWCDFEGEVKSIEATIDSVDVWATHLRCSLERAVAERCGAWPSSSRMAVLLSGGIDSLLVAHLARQVREGLVAYTLAVDLNSQDAARACEIAAAFKLPLRVVQVEPTALVSEYRDTVRSSEIYHLANVYCAAGMRALGRALAEDGVEVALCGEGVNEGVGDYRDWVVEDPRTGLPRTLQCVDDRTFTEVNGRLRYVWGRFDARSRYNLQLGSGLAKHGTSRMIKPLLDFGIELECPWLERETMASLVALPGKHLIALGGKPGLMAKVFRRDIERGLLPERFLLESRKIRLQDGSELGRGGLTRHLLAAGFDQAETLRIFNEIFGASLDPERTARRLGNWRL
jgi:asparagine synthetase B (glutamine-hydrolysing)